MADGDRFSYGGYTFQAILTPRPHPGAHGAVGGGPRYPAPGDHVLFDITPNITVWPSYANPLGGYLDSLALVRRLPVRLPCPPTGQCRLGSGSGLTRSPPTTAAAAGEVLTVLSATPGLTAYDLTARMTWDIRCRGWGRTSRCPRSGSP